MKNGHEMKTALLAAASVLGFVLLRCANLNTGGTETGDGRISAVLYNPDGTPAKHATVRFYPYDYNPYTGGLGKTVTAGAIDTTTTDENGNYTAALNPGIYNILANDDCGYRAYHDSITAIKGDTLHPPADTLKTPGTIKGVVQLHPGDDARSTFILFMGTNTWTRPDDTCGNFTAANMAGGKYRVRISPPTPNYTVTDTGLTVTSGKIDSVKLQINFNPNPVTIMTSAGGLQSFIGMPLSKIAFVNVSGNNRTLCCVDFSKTFSAVWEFLDDRNVYLPTISPDGHYVACCSSNEGQYGPSKITIRSLDSLGSPRVVLTPDTAYSPRWWVNPTSGDTCIVYTNSAGDNGSVLWPMTKTYLQKISGGLPVGSPQELISDGSYYGGISLDGHYTVTGYTRLMMKDLWANSAGQQMFLSPQNGKDLQGSTQVCNVSISPDTGSCVRCLFLDFGYQKTSTVTNCSYGIHEYLFVSTMADSIVNHIHCPAGEQEWDNPKWSNQPRFAVGCGRNSVGQANAVYVIDLDSKNVLQILTGTELQQPYLWIGKF